jgi:hypothetical protein
MAVSRRFVWLFLALLALAVAGPAAGAQFIARDAIAVRFSFDAAGNALVSYSAGGLREHVILDASAVNAKPPSQDGPQTRFHERYLDPMKPRQWVRFTRSCGRYDGPSLPYLVAACRAADGSYWAAQNWPTPLPDLGFTPWTSVQRQLWLDVSHWSGPLPRLEVWQGWAYDNRFQEVFGRLSYRRIPVYGFGTTRTGAPTDGYGRLLYLDTYGSRYGQGWRRENSFVSHNPTGAFCYGFFPFDPYHGGYTHPPDYTGGLRGPGVGTRYRLLANGPGVTPDVLWEGAALGTYNRSDPHDRRLKQQSRRILTSITAPTDHDCRNGA